MRLSQYQCGTISTAVFAAVLAALSIASPARAPAQSVPLVQTESMKRGRQIMEDALTAMGGERFRKLRNKVERGRMYSFHREQLAGLTYASVYTQYLEPPENPDPKLVYQRERQAIGKKKEKKDEDWAVLFTEDDGYEITFRGVRPLKEETVERYRVRRRNDIEYILRNRLDEPGILFQSRGTEIVNNFPMEIVDIIDSQNNVVTAYFHYSTKMPSRVQFEMRDEDNVRHVETIIYDNYRDAGGGVMLPWVVQRQRDGDRVFSMFAESVEINQNIAAGLLTLPDGMEMLERQQ